MKMCKVMKKKQIIKRPSIRQNTWRVSVHARKVQRTTQNVRARARKAARNGKQYQTTLRGLGDVAALAYAAEEKGVKAMARADRAHDAADEAREAADEAKKDAVCARAMVFQNSKRITRVEGTLAETMARVRKNEERLDADDRQRGYITPEARLNVDNRHRDSTPFKGYVRP